MDQSGLRRFLTWLNAREAIDLHNHDDLWSWSVANLSAYWDAMWDYVSMSASTEPSTVLIDNGMPDVQWFPGARLNYAEHCLRSGADDEVALLCFSEVDLEGRKITRRALRRQVACLSAWLRSQGVRPGERVVGYLPNTEHAVIACLAAASVGAVWSICSPDFGAEGTVTRLSQLEPVVIFAADGYHWNGKVIDRRDVRASLRSALPSLRATVQVPYVFDEVAETSDDSHRWDDVTTGSASLEFEQVDFAHPLWVLFSSGTTGTPKGLVQGHGGITLQHLAWNALYLDVGPGDRMFTYTSTGWMLWNLLLSTLAFGATTVLYEGSPGYPDAGLIWDIASRTGSRAMLVGAALITSTQQSGIRPRDRYDLSQLQTLMVSGSALPSDGYSFVLDGVGPHVRLDSTSGGTDICAPFIGGNDLSPVWAGEISGPLAGVSLEAWDDEGCPVVGTVGEMVIKAPTPSMPLFMWNDTDGERYQDTYFDPWPGVWRHGDWITMTERGTVVVHGRSDATLNRDGVRLGSADFYDVVDALPGVVESLVIGIDEPGGGYYLPLFVALEDGRVLDDDMRQTISRELRGRLSPRHVPDDIIAVPAIPHTLTGKRLEVPIKRLLAGVELERAVSLSAVDRPEVVLWFREFAQARIRARGLQDS